jgi:hypothetical protein
MLSCTVWQCSCNAAGTLISWGRELQCKIVCTEVRASAASCWCLADWSVPRCCDGVFTPQQSCGHQFLLHAEVGLTKVVPELLVRESGLEHASTWNGCATSRSAAANEPASGRVVHRTQAIKAGWCVTRTNGAELVLCRPCSLDRAGHELPRLRRGVTPKAELPASRRRKPLWIQTPCWPSWMA